MEYPKLRAPAATRQIIEAFGGYNHNLRIGDGEFYEMQNMSSDHYPVLSPRARRGVYAECKEPLGLVYKNALCYTQTDPDFDTWGYVNVGKAREYLPVRHGVGDKEFQMVSMGAYLVMPACNIWLNTAKYDPQSGEAADSKRFGMLEESWDLYEGNTAAFSPCRADGTLYKEGERPTVQPENPANGDLWLDNGVLKQWSSSGDGGIWNTVVTTYVRISSPRINSCFEQYDGIKLSGIGTATDAAGEESDEARSLNGSAVIWELGTDPDTEEEYIVVQGMLSKTLTVADTNFSIRRTMPEMDFVIECGNRLWGCRYGENAKGEFVNEIYCSKLGDFKNWSCFMGISTDSATLQLGSDGPFTGAVSYMGHPIFFKENVLHKVYISATGAHSVVDTPCPGVQSGCAKSLAIVGDTLFYKSRSGIMAYDGSLPVTTAPVFGTDRYDSAAAGAFGSKYYISMRRADGSWHLFVYDTQKGLWHREDALQVTEFASGSDKLYGISGDQILILAGAEAPGEKAVEWSVQTGPMDISTPDRKYLTRLNVRMSLAPGAEAALHVQYDFSPRWEHLLTVTGSDLGSFDIPIRPKRCDHMRLRITGRGDGKVYSFTKTVEQGSDSP